MAEFSRSILDIDEYGTPVILLAVLMLAYYVPQLGGESWSSSIVNVVSRDLQGVSKAHDHRALIAPRKERPLQACS